MVAASASWCLSVSQQSQNADRNREAMTDDDDDDVGSLFPRADLSDTSLIELVDTYVKIRKYQHRSPVRRPLPVSVNRSPDRDNFFLSVVCRWSVIAGKPQNPRYREPSVTTIALELWLRI